MLKDDAVSNLVALSFAALIFLSLFGLLVLQTVDNSEVTIPGNHESLADTLYRESVYGTSTNCPADYNGCMLQLGLLDSNGFYNTAIRDDLIAGLAGDLDTNLAEGEMLALLDGGWFRILPHNVDRDVNVLIILDPDQCGGPNHPSPWPLYADANVECEKDNGGTLAIPANTRVVVLNGNRDQFDVTDLVTWHQAGTNRVLIFADAQASTVARIQSHIDTGQNSYLGGLFDLSWPEVVSYTAGSNGDAPINHAAFQVIGPTAASRLGSYANQIIVTTLGIDAPGFQNLLAHTEPGFLEVGSRDDFASATRLMVACPIAPEPDGTCPTGNLFTLDAWSAPSTY